MISKKLRYAVTGANGQIGSFLVNSLRQSGHVVYELVRSKEKAKDSNYFRYFDLADPNHVPSLEDIDVLIHTAHFFDTLDKNYEKINITGTIALFNKCKSDSVPYSIFISTISAHKDAKSLYGRVKYQLENSISSFNVAIIRPGLIFNDPLKGIIHSINKLVEKLPVIPLIGTGNQNIYPCHLHELASFITDISINQPQGTTPIIAASEKPITLKNLIKYFSNQKGKNVIILPIPYLLIYTMLKFSEYVGLPIGLRSDSLLGFQFGNLNNDFSEARKLGAKFNGIMAKG